MKTRRLLVATATTLVVSMVLASVAAASPPRRPQSPGSANSILTTDTARRIDVNQINMFVTNIGSFANDAGNVSNGGNEGLYFPRGTPKNAMYAAGPYVGCQINGTTHVTVSEYDPEFGAGPIIDGSASLGTPGGVSAVHTDPRFIVYKVVRFTGDPADTGHVERSAADLLVDGTADRLVHHSWSEYMHGAAPFGAPWKYYTFHVKDGPDSLVPGPDVAGDMMLWAVYNDADAARHVNQAGKTEPIGLEVQQTTWAYNRQGPLGNTIFVRYKLINKGLNAMTQSYFSQWSDPDLGGFTDDLVGCDTLPDATLKPRSLGYCYNASNNDQLYGGAPPAIGFDFFRGPRTVVSNPATTLGMTSFNKYANGNDPSSADETYFYMQGLAPDGSDVQDPYGQTTRFVDAGNPVAPTPTDWLDSNPGDRRMMLSSGPFDMAPGDTQEVVVGLVIGQGNDRLSSISGMRYYDEFAQAAFDSSFNLPYPPPQPKVTTVSGHGSITLNWDNGSITNFVEPGYAFEGYNVYQGASVAGPWKRLATFDVVNNVRVIFDQIFDINTGQVIPQYPVAFGSDDGLQYSFTTTQDAIRGGPLYDGTQYYYAVTAYAQNPTGLPKVEENAQAVVRTMPQRPASGTDPGTATVSAITYVQKDPGKPATTDHVDVTIVDPSKVTGHTYKVSLDPLVPPFTGLIGGLGPFTVNDSWSVTDSTTGTLLYSGQLNRNGDSDYRLADGLQIALKGIYAPALAGADFTPAADEDSPIAPVNWGMTQYGGGAGTEPEFGAFATTLDPAANPDSFTTVELRFGVTQKCYRYFRLEKNSQDAGSPPAGRAYLYGGYQDCNFQVWDTVHNVQLDAFFVERMQVDSTTYVELPANEQPASQDATWDPGNDPGTGDREYLCILTTPYSDTPKAPFAVDGVPIADPAVMPITYFLGAYRPDPSVAFVTGEKFTFTWGVPATSNDIFVFSTTTLKQNNAALAKGRMSSVRAVPNPYYAHSAYELTQFNRVIRFVNMPEQCTVRIYNLAGQRVRTLHKTDASTSVLEWNLLTDYQLPVGSGVYVYEIDSPGAGQTTGRIAVFMERERLNNY